MKNNMIDLIKATNIVIRVNKNIMLWVEVKANHKPHNVVGYLKSVDNIWK